MGSRAVWGMGTQLELTARRHCVRGLLLMDLLFFFPFETWLASGLMYSARLLIWLLCSLFQLFPGIPPPPPAPIWHPPVRVYFPVTGAPEHEALPPRTGAS